MKAYDIVLPWRRSCYTPGISCILLPVQHLLLGTVVQVCRFCCCTRDQSDSADPFASQCAQLWLYACWCLYYQLMMGSSGSGTQHWLVVLKHWWSQHLGGQQCSPAVIPVACRYWATGHVVMTVTRRLCKRNTGAFALHKLGMRVCVLMSVCSWDGGVCYTKPFD